LGIYSIKPVFQRSLEPLEGFFVRHWVHPDYITGSALLLSLGGGLVFYFSDGRRWLLLLIPLMTIAGLSLAPGVSFPLGMATTILVLLGSYLGTVGMAFESLERAIWSGGSLCRKAWWLPSCSMPRKGHWGEMTTSSPHVRAATSPSSGPTRSSRRLPNGLVFSATYTPTYSATATLSISSTVEADWMPFRNSWAIETSTRLAYTCACPVRM